MNKLVLLKVGIDKTAEYVSKYTTNSADKNELLDPFTTLCKLALLNFHIDGTKISVDDNRIYFQEPGMTQTITRWYNNYRREDLHQLMNPIKKFEEMYYIYNEPGFLYIINLSIEGVNKLIKTYSANNKKTGTSVVLHSLEMYKNILLNLQEKCGSELEQLTEFRERRLSSVSQFSLDNAEDNILSNYIKPMTSPSIESIRKISLNESPNIKPSPFMHALNDNISMRDNSEDREETPIKSDYKEFSKLWTKNEIIIIHQLFYNAVLCRDKKRPHEHNIKAIIAFLEGKDDLFKNMVDKLVSEL